MQNLKVAEVVNKSEWENFLMQRNPSTFLQSWNWGETNKYVGFKVVRFGLYMKTKLVGVAQLIHQPAKRGSHYLIPGGPVVDYKDKNKVKFFLSRLKDFAEKEKVWFIRIRPDEVATAELDIFFKNIGLKKSPMHVHGEHTLVLDISKSEEEILKSMRKNTRYAIKKSLDEGFKITTTSEVAKVEILEKLQEATVKRHKFVGFNKRLFEAQMSTFGKDKQALLFICEKREEPLVCAIVIFYGKKAFYHHSGSSESARNSNASYFTQWQIIKKAKELNHAYYDFWGIAPSDNPKHRFYGVTLFKKGFGGKQVDYVKARDIVISPLYIFTYIFETVRKFQRHL